MENLFYQPDLPNGIHSLNEDESRHCIKVLRKNIGDVITITDGNGAFYTAKITEVKSAQCNFIIQSISKVPKRKFSIHLAISPTKSQDRIEWMVEKCVELGIDTITLLKCRNTERNKFNLARIKKVAISAMKQSHQAWLPVINSLIAFTEFMQVKHPETSRFIAHVDLSNPEHLITFAKPAEDYLVLVGPEGDFTADELLLANQNDFKKVSLGNTRLRTETAGLSVCQILNLINI